MPKYLRGFPGLLLAAALVPLTSGQVSTKAASDKPTAPAKVAAKGGVNGDNLGRNLVPARWYESAAAIVHISINPARTGRPQLPLDPAEAGPTLDDFKARGTSAIEIFAPYYGGNSYDGLDPIDHFRINPKLGTMEDFRKLVRLIHSKGMAVISFVNLGYTSTESPEFMKACDDVRAGKDTVESRRFLWADHADAPPPAPDTDRYFFVRPHYFPYKYDAEKAEFWEYNERAGKYFWTKWLGPNLDGKVVRLPQYNWDSEEFQQQAEKVVRFWMDQGLDGMIIDAVNWYIHHTWEKDRRRITDVIASYGNAYSQPEGGGAFYEDPVGWITEGGWKSVQDYGLAVYWEEKNVIGAAVDKGDPRPLEQALRDYHDRVVAAGGVLYYDRTVAVGGPLYFFGGGRGGSDPEKGKLSRAISASIGEILASGPSAGPADEEWVWLLRTKAAHKALNNVSSRRQIPTRADDKHYAFLRTARDGSERILVVMNFQSTPQAVELDMSGVATAGLVELKSGELAARQNPFKVELPPYGYRFYQVKDPIISKGK